MKINKIAFFLLLLFLQIQIFSQFADLPIQNQKDYKLLNEEIQKVFKNSKCFSYMDTTLRLFTVFNLRTTDTITKEEYIDGSFLKKLRYYYFYDYKNRNKSFTPPKDSIVVAYIAVYATDKHFIANFSYDYKRFFNRRKSKEYDKYDIILWKKLCAKSREECEEISIYNTTSSFGFYHEWRKYMWDKGNFFIFRVPEKKHNVYFIINEQLEIFVFYGSYEFPIKEFMDKHWEQFSKEEGMWLN
jgi:hypothetical protein